MEKKKTEAAADVLDTNGNVIENENLLIFNKPYQFEGETYKSIDLSGLEDITAADMIAANKVLERSGSVSVIPEMSLEYACVIASRATKQPIEFFQGLKPKDAIKLKNRVTSFFYGRD